MCGVQRVRQLAEGHLPQAAQPYCEALCVQVSWATALTMTAQGTVLHQCPSKVLLLGPKATRPQRIAQRVLAQAQPSRPAQQSRPNTAVQAAAVAEAPTHTSRVSEKQMGDGPTLVNGQVGLVQAVHSVQLC